MKRLHTGVSLALAVFGLMAQAASEIVIEQHPFAVHSASPEICVHPCPSVVYFWLPYQESF